MTSAFFVSDSSVALVANDNGISRYRARRHSIASGVQSPALQNDLHETVIFVEHGSLEMMVGGAVGFVTEGHSVRVPAKVVYAWRNVGDEPASVLTRDLAAIRCGCRVTIHIAAA